VNTPTAVGTYVFGFVIVVLIGVVIRRMLRGWKRRSQQQVELIGTLPAMPDMPGAAVLSPTRGMYVGCTLAPDWLNRVTVDDLGYRSKAVLTRYPEGILLERSGTGPIWIPQESITGVRTERGLAGKVLPGAGSGTDTGGGILVIRWRLPSGTEIDTGFRGDDRAVYPEWTTGEAA
jgi:hypothetical protein